MRADYSARANGKLLLTAEYLVLDGAEAIALPCKYGQRMRVTQIESSGRQVQCRSLDAQGQAWFEGIFDLGKRMVLSASDEEIANRFLSILSFISDHGSKAFP